MAFSKTQKITSLCGWLLFCATLSYSEPASVKTLQASTVDEYEREKLFINSYNVGNIYVQNNVLASSSAIESKIPYRKGDVFDPKKTSELIKGVYSLGYFSQVKLLVDIIDDSNIDLYILVEEKPKLTKLNFVGNKQVSQKSINEDIKPDSILAISEAEVPHIVQRMKKLYEKKSYHNPDITYTYDKDTTTNTVEVTIKIKENSRTPVTKIDFVGNKRLPSKVLKKLILTREDWILGMLDKSGTYQPEMVEIDKALIEDTYKSAGFLHAKVTDIKVDFNKEKNDFHITYHIDEGGIYFIKTINVPGNELLEEPLLKARIPIREGQLYSNKRIRDSIEILRLVWGEFGYIFADIDPSIDVDEEAKTVNVTFYSDLKDKVHLNRLTVKGNKKTRDKVLRRQVTLEEGQLLTNKKMEDSKAHINRLGYFEERDGVNWKITRLDDHTADVDLLLKEKRTGQFNFQIGYGGSPKNASSPQTGISVQLGVADKNVAGTGISATINSEISQRFRSVVGNLANPWMFDKPIRGEVSAYYKSSLYEEGLQHTQEEPNEKVVGGFIGGGYLFPLLGGSFFSSQLGYEQITFSERVTAAIRMTTVDQAEYQLILDQRFQNGNQFFLQWSIGQDVRNGLAYPTQGHRWNWNTRIAFPQSQQGFNFFKTEFDVAWYTPLIGEDTLVLCLHGHIGYIKPLNDLQAPWRELFHVGGPATVRAYTYGQIGPMWKNENSLGALKMLNVNVELIMPITSDYSTRGVVFYDGGSGWDTPNSNQISAANLTNNNFFYRHSFGVGIRMTSPTPLQIDFGIKLNPSKQFKNQLTYMHLNMIHEF